MLSVITPNVVMLGIEFYCYAEDCFAECHYAECRCVFKLLF